MQLEFVVDDFQTELKTMVLMLDTETVFTEGFNPANFLKSNTKSRTCEQAVQIQIQISACCSYLLQTYL